MQNTEVEQNDTVTLLEEQYARFFGVPNVEASDSTYFRIPTAYTDSRPVITVSTLGR
jgi:hypothetical protein